MCASEGHYQESKKTIYFWQIWPFVSFFSLCLSIFESLSLFPSPCFCLSVSLSISVSLPLITPHPFCSEADLVPSADGRVELCRLGWDWAGNYHKSKALALITVAWAIAFSLDAVEYSRDWPRLGARSLQNPAICIESSSHTVIMWFREGRQWRAWHKTALA